MENSQRNQDQYLGYHYLYIIQDPTFLEGKTFQKLTEILNDIFQFKCAFIDADLEGIGNDKLCLEDYTNEFVSIKDCLIFLNKVKNLEWGNIFLFKSFPENIDFISEKNRRTRIALADVTIRAADSNYVLIYTKNKSLLTQFKDNFNNVEVESGKIADLWYPA